MQVCFIRFLSFLLSVSLLLVTGNLFAKKFSTTAVPIIQYDGPVDDNDINQKLFRIEVTVENGTGATPEVNAMNFNLTGFSQMAEIRLYTTGTTATFSSPVLKATQTSPGATVSLSGFSEAYGINGTYYWWLVFDAVSSVTPGTKIDAEYTGGTYVSGPPVFNSNNPTGHRIAGRTYKIGTGEDYPTVKDATDAISRLDYDGNDTIYYEMTANYSNPTEPNITWPAYSKSSFLVFRPESGQTGKITQVNSGAGTFAMQMSGSQRIILEGRPGGVGSNREWILRNGGTTSVIAGVIGVVNDAQWNQFRYCIFESDVESSSGHLWFGSTTGSIGNNNNTVDNCLFRDFSFADGGTTALPVAGIYSSGTAGFENKNNTIKNCEFVDIFNASSANSGGIHINTNSTNWTITGNHFYQTTSHMSLDFSFAFIFIRSGGGYVVNNNFIGGTAIGATGSNFVISSGLADCLGICFSSTVAGGDNIILGNTIRKISYTTNMTSASSPFYGILASGSMNYVIGSLNQPNIIGDLSATGSIVLTNQSASGSLGFSMIRTNGSGEVTVEGNSLGGLTLGGSRNNATSYVIQNSNGILNASNNTIGGTIANSIQINSDSEFHGISDESSNNSVVNNNTLQNIDHNATTQFCFGIKNNSGDFICNNNILKKCTTDANVIHQFLVHTGSAATVNGNIFEDITLTSSGTNCGADFLYSGTASAVIISNNVIGSSTNNNIRVAGDNGTVGIFKDGVGSATIQGNTIQEFDLTGTGTNTELTGINVNDGSVSIINNTIKELDVLSTRTAGPVLRAIYYGTTAGSNEVKNNTIQNLNASTSGAVNIIVRGISCNSGSGEVSSNFINGITNSSTGNGSQIVGMFLNGAGTWDGYNNVVLVDNGSNTNDLFVKGIESLTNSTLYYNTISVSGSVSAGSSASAGYFTSAGTTQILKNNIIQNVRTGGTGGHRAINFSNNSLKTADYNYLENDPSESSNIGKWGPTDYNFADWKTNSGAVNDQNGTETIDAFGYAPAGFVGANMGVDVTPTVNKDRMNIFRDATPWMGAYEGPFPGSPLCGSYTIGGASPDYTTFTNAISDLQSRGISCSVTFNVRTGTYNEQIYLYGITGTNATDTVVFQSESLDSTDAVLSFSALDADGNYTVTLEGASYITFRKMTIKATGTTYGTVFDIFGGYFSVNILNSEIIGVSSAVANDDNSLILSEFSVENNFDISNNRILNGSRGVRFTGPDASNLENLNRITGNVLIDQYESGIYISFQNASLIKDNTVSTTSAYNPYIGIRCENCDNGSKTVRNKVSTSTAFGYGIYIESCDGVSGNSGLIANNMIQFGTAGTARGMYVFSSNFQNIYHNSINLTSSHATNGRAFYINGGGNNYAFNNIFVNNGGGYAIGINTAGALADCDNNNLYTTGTNLGFIIATDYVDIFDWRTANSSDLYSVSVDPLFISTTDLHLSTRQIPIRIGLNQSAVPLDIDGDSRGIDEVWAGCDDLGNSTITTFSKNYGGTAWDGSSASDPSNKVLVLSDGSIIFGGYTWSFGAGDRDFYLIKLDANGNEIWSKTYGGAGADVMFDVATCADGGIIMCGETASWGAGSDDVLIIKVDALGVEEWSTVIGGSAIETAYNIEEAVDGSFFIIGETASFGAGGNDNMLIKITSTGTLTFFKTYGESGTERGYGGFLTQSGDVIMHGFNTANATWDAYVVKVDPSGNIIYQNEYGKGGTDEIFFGGSTTADGGLIMVGETGSDGYVVKLKADGTEEWSKSASIGSAIDLYGVRQTTTGFYVISGNVYSLISPSFVDMTAIYMDSQGSHLWSYAYGGVVDDFSYNVAQAIDDGILIGGQTLSLGSGSSDYFLVKTDLNGNSGCEEKQYNPTVSAFAMTIAASSMTISTPSPTVTAPSITTTSPTTITTTNCSSVVPSAVYWVGNAGNWNDNTHWSYTTGGSICSCLPDNTLDVIFDGNSFSAGGQVITVPAGTWNVKTIDFQDASKTPAVKGTGAIVIGQ